MDEGLINNRTNSNISNSTNNSITSNSTNPDICTICLDVCNNKSKLNCNHVFCTECINTLINNKKYNCPLCRTLISTIVDNNENITNIRNVSLIMPNNSRINSCINTIPLIVFTFINIGIFALSDNCGYIERCLDDCLNQCSNGINLSYNCYF